MVTQSRPKEPGGEQPKPKKVAPKKTTPQKAVSDGPPTSAEAEPATKAKRLPAATRRALRELKAGELTRYEGADDLFEKLGINLGHDQAQSRPAAPDPRDDTPVRSGCEARQAPGETPCGDRLVVNASSSALR
jgi:hypothetical protein